MAKVKRKRQTPVEITEEEMQAKMFLTIPEAAGILRVSIRTVFKLMSTQQLQSVRISAKKTVIPKKGILQMAEKMNSRNQSMLTTKAKVNDPSETEVKPKAKAKPKRNTRPAKPKQTVTGSFSESIQGEVYTMAEICAKFNYTYGRFYNLRLRHEIPCVKGQSTKCFPKDIVDKVMAEEAERMGKANSEDWYTCFDIMKLYGLGKTQVRRFAETHGVRIRKAGKHFNQYLKADWEAARKEAESKSSSTKSKRETT